MCFLYSECSHEVVQIIGKTFQRKFAVSSRGFSVTSGIGCDYTVIMRKEFSLMNEIFMIFTVPVQE